MPLAGGSSGNLWARLAEGPATARCAPGTRPKRSAHCSPAPQPRHLQAGGRPPHPFPAKRLLPSLRQPGSGQAEQPASPGASRGRAAPTPPAVPRRPADARPPPPLAVFPPLHSAHPPGRPSALPALSAPPRGASRRCGPDPRVAASPGSLLCPPPARPPPASIGNPSPARLGGCLRPGRGGRAVPFPAEPGSVFASGLGLSASPPPQPPGFLLQPPPGP